MSGARRDTLELAGEAAGWLMTLPDADTATRTAFVKWLRASPRHVEEFLLVTASDHAMQRLDADRRIDLDGMMAALGATVVPMDPAEVPARRTGRRDKRRVWGLAALAAGMLIAAGLWLGHSRGLETYTTAIGEQRTVQLADGSLVHLNAGSRVRVQYSARRRDIRLLEGEALYTVAREASRPFRVVTDRAVIRAIGTQFNVNRQMEGTTVTVLEGAVEVTRSDPAALPRRQIPAAGGGSEKPPAVTQLRAGEAARVKADGEIIRSAPNVADAIAWRQRKLVFSDSTLEEIAAEFNRYNRTHRLIVADPRLREQRYGGTFDADGLALIEFLRRTPGLTVEAEGDRLMIRSRQGR